MRRCGVLFSRSASSALASLVSSWASIGRNVTPAFSPSSDSLSEASSTLQSSSPIPYAQLVGLSTQDASRHGERCDYGEPLQTHDTFTGREIESQNIVRRRVSAKTRAMQ